MASKKGEKKTSNGNRRGISYVLDREGNPLICDKCHQKVRQASAKKVLSPEEIERREIRIQNMMKNLEEIKRVSS